VTRSLVISIDAMGGDHGPPVVVPAVAQAAAKLGAEAPTFLLHGDPEALKSEIARCKTAARWDIRPAERVIASDEKPAVALRRGKGTSLWNAVEAVKGGEAGAAVSAGNTGALMAISRLILRMTGELERPPLVATWPGMKGVTTVLDVGANVDCDAARLVQFAIMGEAFHRAAHGVKAPTVGLLNVGSEDMKGHGEVREANRLMREGGFHLDYRGFVEGDDIAKNTVNVVVTDGFSGNIALKTAEGVARFVSGELRKELTSSLPAKLGAFLAQGALRRLRQTINPYAGAPLLGLNGVVVKAHGGTDVRGFAGAVLLAIDLARSGLVGEIDRNMKQLSLAVGPVGDSPVQGAVSS
jgi:phosphate acyltransferase